MKAGTPSDVPAPGPARSAGPFSPRGAHSPAPIFTQLVLCTGEICLGCDESIVGTAVGIFNATFFTHAHRTCRERILIGFPELANRSVWGVDS